MKKALFVICALAIMFAVPASAQREQNFWFPYEAKPHQSICNPALMAEASGKVHVTTVAYITESGKLHFTSNMNLKGRGTLWDNNILVATFNVGVNDSYREVDLPLSGEPIEISDTYKMNIEVTKGAPADNYYEKETFRYVIGPDLTVQIFFDHYSLECK